MGFDPQERVRSSFVAEPEYEMHLVLIFSMEDIAPESGGLLLPTLTSTCPILYAQHSELKCLFLAFCD